MSWTVSGARVVDQEQCKHENVFIGHLGVVAGGMQEGGSPWGVHPTHNAYHIGSGIPAGAGAGVLDARNRPIPGLHAAGELVGGLFYYNYPGGSGLTSGTVFGRRAGRAAARLA